MLPIPLLCTLFLLKIKWSYQQVLCQTDLALVLAVLDSIPFKESSTSIQPDDQGTPQCSIFAYFVDLWLEPAALG